MNPTILFAKTLADIEARLLETDPGGAPDVVEG